MRPEPDLDRQIAAEVARLAPDGALGVAVSGGGDSMALALAVFRWAKMAGRRVEAATVDHGLRRESAAEAAQVAAFCGEKGISHQTLHWDDRPARGNLSAAGRATRFRLLGGWARERGLAAVLLGHTMDDQAETVLMRLARGSGADGLSGMAERIWREGVWWMRPLLGQRREDLRRWLTREGISWVDDPSNDDPAYDRIKARRALAELAPLGITTDGLVETAFRLARQRQVLERCRADLAARARRWGTTGVAWLDTGTMAEALPDTALGVFAETLMIAGSQSYRPRYRALERVWSEIRSGGFTGASLAGCLIEGDGEQVAVYREPAAVGPPQPLADGAVWDGRWRLCLSGPWPAGRFSALGWEGVAALKSAAGEDILASPDWRGLPAKARQVVPALFDPAGTVLAVPQLGYLEKSLPESCAAHLDDLGLAKPPQAG